MNIDLLPVNKYLHGKCMTNGGKVFTLESLDTTGFSLNQNSKSKKKTQKL
jgi:hypothetical protein|tara:strand:+ start:709 stop:858 length:150 start_codon:yes stop_codon:yes gene_type:complete